MVLRSRDGVVAANLSSTRPQFASLIANAALARRRACAIIRAAIIVGSIGVDANARVLALGFAALRISTLGAALARIGIVLVIS